MKTKFLILIFALAMTTASSFAQQNTNPWANWERLIGNWKGEGDGKPGQGSGSFSLQPDLQGKVLIRKNHSEYPAQGNTPATVHDDLMIVYLDNSGSASKAIYFDNEGHTINYAITYELNKIILTSDVLAGMPRFRLTYEFLDDKTVDVKFEMSSPGTDDFRMYLDGKCMKVS